MASKLKKQNIVIVIASFAIDHIIDVAGVLRKRRGGPAHWIRQALKEFRMPFLVISGPRPALVDMRLGINGERGSFRRVDPIHLRASRSAKAFIISTIENEFPVEQVHLLHGVIAVDLQGYIRNARVSGTLLHISSSVARRITIAKATAGELTYVQRTFITSQKKRILIVTHDVSGFEIFYRGRSHSFIGNNRVVSPDTIGAGDTFLTAFTIEWLRTLSVSKAALKAQAVVEHFLNKKARSMQSQSVDT